MKFWAKSLTPNGNNIKLLFKNSYANAASGNKSKSGQTAVLTSEWTEISMTKSFSADHQFDLSIEMQLGKLQGDILIDHITSTVKGGADISGGENSPYLILENVQGKEGETVQLNMILTQPATVDTTVDLVVNPDTADSSDYALSTTQVTIPAGTISFPVNIVLTDDGTVEPEERLKFLSVTFLIQKC